MKGKYLLWLLSLSPVLAGLASYGINLIAAVMLKSAGDYSHYLSLQSWAVYFGSLSTLCLVDMKLSPSGHRYSAFRLFGMATVASLLSLIGMALASSATGSITLLVVGITGFFYASLRNLMMVALMKGIPAMPIGLRLTRAGVLLVLVGLLYACVQGHVNPLHFIGVQAVAAASAIALYATRVPVAVLHRVGTTLRLIWELDRSRWVRRNLSYLVDMAHTPMFYMAIGMVATMPNYKIIIYTAGFFLPLAAMLNEIIGERFRLRLGLTNLDGLRNWFSPYARIGRTVLFLCIALYASTLMLAAAAFSDVFPNIVALILCLLMQTFLVCASSTFSAVISRAGLETFDLTINLIVLLLQFGILYSVLPSPTIVLCVSLAISAKYIAQLLMAYSKIARKI